MKRLLFIIGFCCVVAAVNAQNITRVTTLVAKSPITNSVGAITGFANATNYISIPAGEAVRVSSLAVASLGFDETNYADFWFVRDGWYWTARQGTVVEGPVHFVIELFADSDTAARMTLERWKVAKR